MPQRKPLGEPLRRFGAGERVPFPSREFLDRVEVNWDANCPPFFRGLLSAGEEKSRFDYDAVTGLYSVRRSGRVLKGEEIAAAFQVYMRNMRG